MPSIDFPYRFDGRGRTATSSAEALIRDLIEQVLLTAPGERVMRPEFGSGLLQLVFEPNASSMAATTQTLIQASLQEHLSHLIAVLKVQVSTLDGRLQVTVEYRVLSEEGSRRAVVTLPGAPA